MKYSTLFLSLSLASLTTQVHAFELPSIINDHVKTTNTKVSTTKTKVNSTSNQTRSLKGYATDKLGLSKETVTGGLGALFKVAKDNFSIDDFSTLSKSIPDISSYIKQAPADSSSSIGSLLQSSDISKKVASASYLDSAFKKLGIPKESLPIMVDTVSGYLDSNGYGKAAGLLKKGLSFL